MTLNCLIVKIQAVSFLEKIINIQALVFKAYFYQFPETLAEDWEVGLGDPEATSRLFWFWTCRTCPGGELYLVWSVGEAPVWLAGCDSLILANGTPEICFRFWFSLTTKRTGRLPGELIGGPAWTVVTTLWGVWWETTDWFEPLWPDWTGWTRAFCTVGLWAVRIGVPDVTVTVWPVCGVTGCPAGLCGKILFWTCLKFWGVPLWTCPFFDTNWICCPGTSREFSPLCILIIWFVEFGRTGFRVGVVETSSRFTRRRGGPPEDDGIKIVWPWTFSGPC